MKLAPNRKKIMNILKRDNEITVEAIMEHFTISEVAVRRHINELEKQDLIKKCVVKQKIGRPYYTYHLTKKGHQTFPNQYESLPVELLSDLEKLYGEKAVQDVLTRRMERERKEFEQKMTTEDLDTQVAEVAKIQNEKGYMVEYKKKASGEYEMFHYNCPIANIAARYKQVCKNEKKVFSDIFPTCEVETNTCIVEGDSCCKWTIKRV